MFSLLPTGEGTSNPIDNLATRVDNEDEVQSDEIDDEPIQKCNHNGFEIVLLFEPKVIPSIIEGSDSNNEVRNNTRRTQEDFRPYEPPYHMLDVDIES